MSSIAFACIIWALVVSTPTSPTAADAAFATRNLVGLKCQRRCGELEVPYPFGVRGDSKECYRNELFQVTCNTSTTPHKAFYEEAEVTDFFLSTGKARIFLQIAAYQCFNRAGLEVNVGWQIALKDSTKRLASFSYTENVFTAIGCDTAFFVNNTFDRNYTNGCISVCGSLSSVTDGECSGVGCCQVPVQRGLKDYSAFLSSLYRHSKILNFNKCSYAFLVEKGNYTFRVSDLQGMDVDREFPVIMDWYIGNQSCQEAMKNITDYACASSNSDCFDSQNGPGYFCNCSKGYDGNPYVQDGCQDVNECHLDRELYPCFGICTNTPGSYNCTCEDGTHSNDPTKMICMSDATEKERFLVLKLILGTSSGILLFFAVGLLFYCSIRKRDLMRQRQKYYEQNGGGLLRRSISSCERNSFKIFTMSELEKATKNFDKSEIIGRGGFGIVYKGLLDDGREVAVKKSMTVDEKKSKEFAREMFILSQINHKNIVKLLGCCLEVEVPMLVYEYIPNGTLFNVIHNRKRQQNIPFALRLKIAIETAEALRYLHNDALPPVLHGDVKSSNILLDDDCTAKVSDFGTSKLAPKDKAQIATLVQGTLGYLDPEYLQTCQLTQKSDVYSFGVVLVELLTRKKALYTNGLEEEKCLAFEFISCMNKENITEILDPSIINEGISKEVSILAEVAFRCLRVRGDERPTMKKVERELEGLKLEEVHPWMPCTLEEVHGESSQEYFDGSAIISLKNRIAHDM